MRKQCESMAAASEDCEYRDSTLRRRYKGETPGLVKKSDNSISEAVKQNEKYDKKEKVRLGTGTYWLTRIVLLRFVAFIYCEFNIVYNSTITYDLLTEVTYRTKNILKYSHTRFICRL